MADSNEVSIVDTEIVPLLKKVKELCKLHKKSLVCAVSDGVVVGDDGEEQFRVFVSSYYTPETHPSDEMKLASILLGG